MYNILKKKRDSFSEAKRAHQVQKSFIQTVRSVKQPRTMKTIIYNDIFRSLRRKKVQSGYTVQGIVQSVSQSLSMKWNRRLSGLTMLVFNFGV